MQLGVLTILLKIISPRRGGDPNYSRQIAAPADLPKFLYYLAAARVKKENG
jgi:hypothetical protein